MGAAHDPQTEAPYADALRKLSAIDWARLHVPAHQASAAHAPGIAALLGERALSLDFPMSVAAIDRETWRAAQPGRATPLARAQDLAADAWGARRAWFITNGASGGNHIATTVARALGPTAVVQRSVHSSVIDGIAHVGLDPVFAAPSVDQGLAAAHGVTAEQIEAALCARPDASSVYIVSPSYFGAVADIAAIADVAHAHGVPLIVDEAWGSHFGMHPQLPTNAVRLGADLVVSSTHKGAGSLTQSAMIHLGHHEHARRIEAIADRVVRSFQSTSCSALLLASLDLARRDLMVDGKQLIGAAVASAEAIRAGVKASPRFRDATPDLLAFPDVVTNDPLKVVIDMRGAGITGSEALHTLITDHHVYAELATPAALVLLVGATSPADVDRVLMALHALPTSPGERDRMRPLPAAGSRAMGVRDAFFAPTRVVRWENAVDQVSADSLAAYPPGIPNVLPGERLTPDVIDYLRTMAATPSGFVRGAHDPLLDGFRVVDDPTRATER
ncbi:aminotransferase class I/II-fold pyridoxal phosphate-dependent enzyme [Microbacterium panaciterrae]|uniref:Aminotransferase class I/II-fold pyridoxal phosphate-dependent enzyme n=2 Tax=Microbacterium panaciterrae TaxID=985759 RepID=A0ABP8PRX5_9MICO